MGRARFGADDIAPEPSIEDIVPMNIAHDITANLYLNAHVLDLINDSHDFAVRMKHAQETRNNFVRAQMLALMGAPICRDMLLACIHENFVLPRTYLLMAPFVDVVTAASIWTNRNIGNVYTGYIDNLKSLDGLSGKINIRFSYKMGAVVTRPLMVHVQQHTLFKRYLRGGSTKLVNPDTISTLSNALYSDNVPGTFTIESLDKRDGDWFSFGIGAAHFDKSAVFMDGTPDRSGVLFGQVHADALTRPSHPGWLYVREFTHFHLLNYNRPMGETFIDQRNMPRYNMLCWQTDQRAFNDATQQFDIVLSTDCGPLGPLESGIRHVLEGGVGMFHTGKPEIAPVLRTVSVGGW